MTAAPQFTPAKREAIRLLVGIAGGTGSGKTYSALRLAGGLAGGARFGLIDTEHRRALQYADEFAFDHAPLDPPFTPGRYLEHVTAAAAAYPVVVVDSASHEWFGDGGVLDMADAEFERMGSREAVRMAMWIAPKREHKRFVNELVRLPAHVILCLRAEPKVEMKRGSDGRMEVVPKSTLPGGSLDGWLPVTDSHLPYECTLSFLLMADAPGVPRPMKLGNELRTLVPLDVPLSEETGARLGAWAAGSESAAPKATELPPAQPEPSPGAEPQHNLATALQALWSALPEGRRPSMAQLAAKVGREDATRTFVELVAQLSQPQAEALHNALSEYATKLQNREGS